MEKKSVEVNGITLSFIDEGEGHALLLCHGFPETSYSWRNQISYFSDKGYRVIAVDMPGYGDSTLPEQADRLSVVRVVGDLVSLMHELGLERVTIIGNDWGTTIAWQAVLMRPDLFTSIVAMGVPFMGRAPKPPTALFPASDTDMFYTLYFQDPGVAEKELEKDIEETIGKIYFAASGDAGPRTSGCNTPNPFGMMNCQEGLLAPLPEPRKMDWLSDEDKTTFVKAFEKSGFSGGLSYYRNLDTNWANEAAFVGATVKVPALFLVGERDTGLSMPGMNEIIDSMGTFIDDLRGTLYIAESGHWLPQEKADMVNDHIDTFLQEIMN